MGLPDCKRQHLFRDEARDVLRAGLETARWITVDDTGARHKSRNGCCTQIGNDDFTWFGTTGSKSRLNFLECLRAGHTDYAINDAALAYMRGRSLSCAATALLANHPVRQFADRAAFMAHLQALGLADLKVLPPLASPTGYAGRSLKPASPDPVGIATEGALWGSITAHGFLCEAVVVSDDAGQFDVGHHALCWVHAERLVYKLDAFTEERRRITAFAEKIGPATAALTQAIMVARPHPEQGFRTCLGILSLEKIYGPARLEAACRRGELINARSVGSIRSILKTGLDRAFLDPEPEPEPLRHGNIRGRGYFH